jgi:hypothetical protein
MVKATSCRLWKRLAIRASGQRISATVFLHPLIVHFANLRPTWLLLDADWSHTKQAGPFLDRFGIRIVSVGRLIWQEGTKMQGKDNAAWYLFDAAKAGPTEFVGR